MMRSAALVFAAVLGVACSSNEGGPKPPPGPDPQLVLRDLGDVVILPVYRDFHARAQELTTAAQALCQAPDAASLDAVQAAWVAARAPWKRSEAFGFGPVVDLRTDTAVDFWPVRVSSVEAELVKTDPVPETYASTLGDTVKGLPVLEYVLFDPEGGDAAVLARLADASGPTRTCAYVVALAVDVEARAKGLVDAWDPAQGDFAGELARAGQGSEVYPERARAINAVVNAFVLLVQEIEGVKLATPLGLRNGGVPQPQLAESWRSQSSRQDILDNLAGVRSMYMTSYGERTGVSFHEAVAALDADLDAAILAQLDATEAAVSAIALPLDQAVIDTPELVNAAFESSKELFRLMAVDMATVLGVTLGFSDNDGD